MAMPRNVAHPRALTRHLLVGLLVVFASCGKAPRTNTTASDAVVLEVEVTSVARLPAPENTNRKRWTVSCEVERIAQGLPVVDAGDTGKVQIHSVVKTFGVDVSSVVRTHCRLAYNEVFADNYDGDITIVVCQR